MQIVIESPPQAFASHPTRDRRIHEIDGLRGWAALSVVTFHFLAETFGRLHVEFLSGYFKLLLDGPLAVYVFFVLSGDSLASAVLSEPDLRSWTHVVAKRYLRLTLPIMASTLITLCVMKLGWTFNVAASQLVHREDWLGTFLRFDGSTQTALKYSLAGVYGWIETPTYNTFLWSIAVEWSGSVLVLLSIPILKNIKYGEAFAVAIAVYAFWLTEYMGMFVFGVILSLIRRRGIIAMMRSRLLYQCMSFVLLIAVYLVDLRRQSYPMPPAKTLLNLCEIYWRNHFFIVSAPVIVFAVYANNVACDFMRSGASQFLGRISFSLYLVQFVVLCSVVSFLIVDFSYMLDQSWASLAIACSSILFCVAAAWPLALLEAKMLRLVGSCANTILRPARA